MKTSTIKDRTHGGDLHKMALEADCSISEIIDFSINLHCEGTPDFLRAALFEAMDNIEAYPSPNALELKEIAAKYYQEYSIDKEQFVFGNGSNELIHFLSIALKKMNFTKCYIVEPAFSEYAIGAEKAVLEIQRLWLSNNEALQMPENAIDFQSSIPQLEANSIVFFANPANPSGIYTDKNQLLQYIKSRKDIIWVIDEAFIEYVGEDKACSLLTNIQDNMIILRSLTKFHSLPAVRLGYLVTSLDLARKIQYELPAWNVNCFAISATLAIFNEAIHTKKNIHSSFAHHARQTNMDNRSTLYNFLSQIKGLKPLESSANYILFKLDISRENLKSELLKNHKIAIRDCSNYYGLEKGKWFRVAVRSEEDNKVLFSALQEILEEKSNEIPKKTPALMIQGTSSDAGKSIIAAAFCRIFKQDGYNVAPFKAQNMSLNSGVTAKGEEMGRAQIVQAQAAGLDPCARMNPLLLKPSSDVGSQVILRGKSIGHMPVTEYIEKKKEIWNSVKEIYDDLASEHDIIVLEGAGSPAEVNLKKHDIVNMRMAKHANASVLLVGDIDRGGIYASLLGTYMTFNSQERSLLLGYLINKFRGDASLLEPAHEYMKKHTNKPVLGVIPHAPKLGVPDEDMAGFSWTESIDFSPVPHGIIDIAVIMLGHVSNYTDVSPLAEEPDVRLRAVRRLEEFGTPHLVIIPGSKSVVDDLENIIENGLAKKIQEFANENKWLFGICGGLQILGHKILDPYAVESDKKEILALDILDITTQFEIEKTLVHISKALSPLNVSTKGYEIHHGITSFGNDVLPLFLRDDKVYSSESERICGYVKEKCWATYLHGVFDDNEFRRAYIDHIRVDLGLEPLKDVQTTYDLEESLDNLADLVRKNTDMQAIYKALGLEK